MAMMTKRKNVQDATLKNVRAAAKRDVVLRATVLGIAKTVKDLGYRIAALEREAAEFRKALALIERRRSPR